MTKKFLGIILLSDLNWVDQVNYRAQKAWKAFHFVIHVFKKGNRNTESLAYTSYSWIWGCMLGSMQSRRDKCARPSRNEICSIY